MNLRPFCLLLGFVLLGTNPVLAGYTYKEDDTRLVNGVLYDINGDPVTGTYEVFYENNIRKSLMPYVNGILNGVGSLYNEKGVKEADMPFVDGKAEGIALVYYEDGCLKEKIPYRNGKINGVMRTFLRMAMSKKGYRMMLTFAAVRLNLITKTAV